jgi:transposase-like protein
VLRGAAAQELNAAFGTKLRSAVEITEAHFEACLTFMRQPQALWTTLRTSKVIERFNRAAMPSESGRCDDGRKRGLEARLGR